MTKNNQTSIFRWPRGKYNGRRISGFSIKLDIDVLFWGFRWGEINNTYWRLGVFGIWIETNYERKFK